MFSFIGLKIIDWNYIKEPVIKLYNYWCTALIRLVRDIKIRVFCHKSCFSICTKIDVSTKCIAYTRRTTSCGYIYLSFTNDLSLRA